MFAQTFSQVENAAAARQALSGGSILWTLSVFEYDCGQLHAFSICPNEKSMMKLMKRHAQRLRQLSSEK